MLTTNFRYITTVSFLLYPKLLQNYYYRFAEMVEQVCIHFSACLCFRRCLAAVEGSEKVASHRSHVSGLARVWMRICLVRSLDCAKAEWHSEQENGFSPVCTRLWREKLDGSENAAGQIWQAKGFSRVWIRVCFFRSLDLKKIFPHCMQTNDLIPLCMQPPVP